MNTTLVERSTVADAVTTHPALLEYAQERGFLVGIAPFLVGVAAVVILITAVVVGIRFLRRQPPKPRPEEQPSLPDSGPVGELHEHRADAEMPHDGRRLMPHEISYYGTEEAPEGEETPPEDRRVHGSGAAPTVGHETTEPGSGNPEMANPPDAGQVPDAGEEETDPAHRIRREGDKPGPAEPNSASGS
ncbi:DUF6479 family protein [Streptomyces alkaliterrae]|uniref:Uncharacterized protein n=1 Tax=Streptomyces alkaliterrae TaxID=2213162 RepID=A0A5P0YTM5_9ACTN|nr:DUF6479 family protein [Streptomyces alkaliterrae]MBB1259419.1 hypothetical protein [Streptomyces alkaliterrae]MQS03270.1 hypothetical protein [Streptomyces alkaliterrae]